MNKREHIIIFLKNFVFDKFTKTYLYVKENTTFVIVLFSIFGGLVQLNELVQISPSYVRFFSATQIVPDALFLLINVFVYLFLILLVLSLLLFLFGDIFYSNAFGLRKLVLLRVFLKKNNVNGVFLLLFFISIYFYVFKYLMVKDGFRFLSKSEFIIQSSVILVLISILYYFHSILKKDDNNVYQMLMICSVMILFQIYTTNVSRLTSKNLIPNNFVNFEKLIKKVEKENPSKITSIIYYNDKYVFLKISNNNSKDPFNKIEVYKLDDVISVKP